MKLVSTLVLIFLWIQSHAQTVVKKDGLFGLMDAEMHFLLDPQFQTLQAIAPNTYYRNHAFYGKKGTERWLYFIDDSVFIAQEIDTFEVNAYHTYIKYEYRELKGLLCIGKKSDAPKYQSYWFQSTHLIPPSYKYLHFHDDEKPIASVCQNGKYGVLDAESNTLIVPCIFECHIGRRSFNTPYDFYFAEAQTNVDLDSLYIPKCQKVFSFPKYSNFQGTPNPTLLLYYCDYLLNHSGNIQLINIATGEVALNFVYYIDPEYKNHRISIRSLTESIISYTIEGKDENGKTFYRILFLDVYAAKMLHEISTKRYSEVYVSDNGFYLSNNPNQLLKKNKIAEITPGKAINWLVK